MRICKHYSSVPVGLYLFTLACILYLVLCDSVTSDVGSATNTNCSPRWIVHPQSRGFGAADNGATTPQGCLDACVANANCRTAEWVYNIIPARCWIHEIEPSRQQRTHHPTILQFDIVRECFTTPGIWRITYDILLKSHQVIFTSRRYASVVYTMALCLSVCLSVTSWCSTIMAKCRNIVTVQHDSQRV